jgi:hypothetical protein
MKLANSVTISFVDTKMFSEAICVLRYPYPLFVTKKHE